MDIQIKPYPLEDDLKQKVEKILDENFGLAAGRTPEQVEEGKNNHYSTPIEYILAFDGNKLIGTQLIFSREIIFQDTKILVGGLGGLCVDKDYRGQGLAHLLLEKAGEELDRLGCDIGMMFTDVDNPRYTSLYNQFGYVILGRDYTFVDKQGQKQSYNAAMISPIKSPEKFKIILESREIVDIGPGEF